VLQTSQFIKIVLQFTNFRLCEVKFDRTESGTRLSLGELKSVIYGVPVGQWAGHNDYWSRKVLD
jgi:hypothetical protein